MNPSEDKTTNNSFVFNVNGANNVAQGYNVNQTIENANQNAQAAEKEEKAVIDAILNVIRTEKPAEGTFTPTSGFGGAQIEQQLGVMGQPTMQPEQVAFGFQEMASMPSNQLELPESKQKILTLVDGVKPWAPQIGKALLAFGKTSLETLASRNPVIAGVIAACKALE